MNHSPKKSLPQPPRKKARTRDSKKRCAACAHLFSKQGLEKLNLQDGLAHRTRGGYLASFREGCELCQFIFELASREYGKKWARDEHLVFRNVSQGEDQNLFINTLQGGLEGVTGTIAIYPFVEQDDPLSALIPRRPLCRDVQSSSVFSAAKKLINICQGQSKSDFGHQKCRYSRDSVLPTRVLQVSCQNGPSSTVYLQVNKTEIRGSYLALSYCWGKQDPNKQKNLSELRKNNEQDLIREIKLEDLEQSVRDAIYVTQQLGFSYLWVDRFCIVQDCPEDKRHEISRMAITYKNATITLAAGTATRASDGFLAALTGKSPVFLPEFKFDIPMKGGSKGTVYLAGEPYEPDHPLDKRGWTLQEFMLSSRMLIFSDYQLLWQCQEIELQSVTGNDAGLEYQQHLESLPWMSFDDEGEPSYGTHDSEKLYLWKTIIHQYTDRDLTNPEDRLPAVTGITTELEKLWRDSHIYGHWVRWFIQLLAWYKPDVDRVEKRHLKRAPSWSWVSVDGSIRFEDPIEVEVATIKILTAATVRLSCRILEYDHIDELKRDSVLERPDFINTAVTAELGDRECQYLLLGKAKKYDNREKGLGLLVLRTNSGSYRRVGMVIFRDISIWNEVGYQNIELEPKER